MFSHGSVKSRLLAHTKTNPTVVDYRRKRLKTSTTHQKAEKIKKKKSKNFAPTVLYRVFHDIFSLFFNFHCCTTTTRHERLRVRPRKIKKKGIQVVGVREISHFMCVCVCWWGSARFVPRVSLAFYI